MRMPKKVFLKGPSKAVVGGLLVAGGAVATSVESEERRQTQGMSDLFGGDLIESLIFGAVMETFAQAAQNRAVDVATSVAPITALATLVGTTPVGSAPGQVEPPPEVEATPTTTTAPVTMPPPPVDQVALAAQRMQAIYEECDSKGSSYVRTFTQEDGPGCKLCPANSHRGIDDMHCVCHDGFAIPKNNPGSHHAYSPEHPDKFFVCEKIERKCPPGFHYDASPNAITRCKKNVCTCTIEREVGLKAEEEVAHMSIGKEKLPEASVLGGPNAFDAVDFFRDETAIAFPYQFVDELSLWGKMDLEFGGDAKQGMAAEGEYCPEHGTHKCMKCDSIVGNSMELIGDAWPEFYEAMGVRKNNCYLGLETSNIYLGEDEDPAEGGYAGEVTVFPPSLFAPANKGYDMSKNLIGYVVKGAVGSSGVCGAGFLEVKGARCRVKDVASNPYLIGTSSDDKGTCQNSCAGLESCLAFQWHVDVAGKNQCAWFASASPFKGPVSAPSVGVDLSALLTGLAQQISPELGSIIQNWWASQNAPGASSGSSSNEESEADICQARQYYAAGKTLYKELAEAGRFETLCVKAEDMSLNTLKQKRLEINEDNAISGAIWNGIAFGTSFLPGLVNLATGSDNAALTLGTAALGSALSGGDDGAANLIASLLGGGRQLEEAAEEESESQEEESNNTPVEEGQVLFVLDPSSESKVMKQRIHVAQALEDGPAYLRLAMRTVVEMRNKPESSTQAPPKTALVVLAGENVRYDEVAAEKAAETKTEWVKDLIEYEEQAAVTDWMFKKEQSEGVCIALKNAASMVAVYEKAVTEALLSAEGQDALTEDVERTRAEEQGVSRVFGPPETPDQLKNNTEECTAEKSKDEKAHELCGVMVDFWAKQEQYLTQWKMLRGSPQTTEALHDFTEPQIAAAASSLGWYINSLDKLQTVLEADVVPMLKTWLKTSPANVTDECTELVHRLNRCTAIPDVRIGIIGVKQEQKQCGYTEDNTPAPEDNICRRANGALTFSKQIVTEYTPGSYEGESVAVENSGEERCTSAELKEDGVCLGSWSDWNDKCDGPKNIQTRKFTPVEGFEDICAAKKTSDPNEDGDVLKERRSCADYWQERALIEDWVESRGVKDYTKPRTVCKKASDDASVPLSMTCTSLPKRYGYEYRYEVATGNDEEAYRDIALALGFKAVHLKGVAKHVGEAFDGLHRFQEEANNLANLYDDEIEDGVNNNQFNPEMLKTQWNEDKESKYTLGRYNLIDGELVPQDTSNQATFDLATAIGQEHIEEWKSLRFVEEVMWSEYSPGEYNLHCKTVIGSYTASTVDLVCDFSHKDAVKMLLDGYISDSTDPSPLSQLCLEPPEFSTWVKYSDIWDDTKRYDNVYVHDLCLKYLFQIGSDGSSFGFKLIQIERDPTDPSTELKKPGTECTCIKAETSAGETSWVPQSKPACKISSLYGPVGIDQNPRIVDAKPLNTVPEADGAYLWSLTLNQKLVASKEVTVEGEAASRPEKTYTHVMWSTDAAGNKVEHFKGEEGDSCHYTVTYHWSMAGETSILEQRTDDSGCIHLKVVLDSIEECKTGLQTNDFELYESAVFAGTEFLDDDKGTRAKIGLSLYAPNSGVSLGSSGIGTHFTQIPGFMENIEVVTSYVGVSQASGEQVLDKKTKMQIVTCKVADSAWSLKDGRYDDCDTTQKWNGEWASAEPTKECSVVYDYSQLSKEACEAMSGVDNQVRLPTDPKLVSDAVIKHQMSGRRTIAQGYIACSAVIVPESESVCDGLPSARALQEGEANALVKKQQHTLQLLQAQLSETLNVRALSSNDKVIVADGQLLFFVPRAALYSVKEGDNYATQDQFYDGIEKALLRSVVEGDDTLDSDSVSVSVIHADRIQTSRRSLSFAQEAEKISDLKMAKYMKDNHWLRRRTQGSSSDSLGQSLDQPSMAAKGTAVPFGVMVKLQKNDETTSQLESSEMTAKKVQEKLEDMMNSLESLTSFIKILNEELSYLPLPLSMMDVGVVTAPSLSPGSVGALASSEEFKNALVAVVDGIKDNEADLALIEGDEKTLGTAAAGSVPSTQGVSSPSMDAGASAKAASMTTALLMLAILLGAAMLYRVYNFFLKRKAQVKEDHKATYGAYAGTINEQAAADEREMQQQRRTGQDLANANENMQQPVDTVSSVNMSSLDTSSQRGLVVPAIANDDEDNAIPSGFGYSFRD